MNTTRFEYMLALEKLGSMSRVAEQYFISASAVSQCLKREEDELGVKLFQKENKKMVPTAAGLIYLKGARQIVDIRQKTMEKMNAAKEKRPTIRIAVSPMLFERVSSFILPELRTSFPDSSLELFSANAKVGIAYLLNDLADFAILGCPPLNHSLLSEKLLGEDKLCLVVPKAYLRNHLTKPPVLEDCAAVPFILVKEGTYARSMANEILTRQHMSLNRVYEVEDYLMAKRFLEDGRGAAFLPSSIAPADDNRHFFVLHPENPSKLSFLLLCLKQRHSGREIEKLETEIQKEWRKIPDRALRGNN